MTKRSNIAPSKKVPEPDAHYSNYMRAGDLIFVSGQTGVNSETGRISKEFSMQTIQAIQNVEAVLEAAGSSLSRVVKLGVYLRDAKDFSKMDKVCQKMFPNRPPARTTVQAPTADRRCLIEIDAVARSV